MVQQPTLLTLLCSLDFSLVHTVAEAFLGGQAPYFNINYNVLPVHTSATQASLTATLRQPLKNAIGQPPASVSSKILTEGWKEETKEREGEGSPGAQRPNHDNRGLRRRHARGRPGHATIGFLDFGRLDMITQAASRFDLRDTSANVGGSAAETPPSFAPLDLLAGAVGRRGVIDVGAGGNSAAGGDPSGWGDEGDEL